MKKLLFVWWWDKAPVVYDYWKDGLRAAIEEMGKTWDVEMSLGEVFPEEKNWEAILIWGDSNCPFLDRIHEYNGKKGIILTTDPHTPENLKKLDTVFCESTPVYEAVRKFGLHAVKAFGTNTDFYTPKDCKKDIQFFYPATFSPWKRQRDIAHLGKELWCVGTVQPDGQEDYDACVKNDVNIAKGYFKAEYIRDLYQRTKNIIIPARHGSERTVLEAMASGIVPEVAQQNPRARSYIEEFKSSGYVFPSDFVVNEYNHVEYAQKILSGLQ